MSPTHRYPQLDSLRGLAALTVVFEHCLRIDPWLLQGISPWLEWAAQSTPLHILWAGGNAVLLFFVLSGLVLTLQVERGLSYVAFAVHRFFRLQVPYIAAITLAMALSWWAVGHGPQLGAWFTSIWRHRPSLLEALNQWSLVGHFDPMAFNPPVWSLVHEMRISLIFPALVIGCRRFGWRTIVAMPLIIAGASALEHLLQRSSLAVDFSATVLYVPLFMLGILLARDRQRIAALVEGFHPTIAALVGAVGLLCYTYPFWVLPGVRLLHPWAADTAMVTVGAAAFIALALGHRPLAGWLMTAPLRQLGRISYSLYLTHVLVLLGLIHLFFGVLPLALLLLIGVAASLLSAQLFYRLVEQPALALGRRLSSTLMVGRQTSRAADRLRSTRRGIASRADA